MHDYDFKLLLSYISYCRLLKLHFCSLSNAKLTNKTVFTFLTRVCTKKKRKQNKPTYLNMLKRKKQNKRWDSSLSNALLELPNICNYKRIDTNVCLEINKKKHMRITGETWFVQLDLVSFSLASSERRLPSFLATLLSAEESSVVSWLATSAFSLLFAFIFIWRVVLSWAFCGFFQHALAGLAPAPLVEWTSFFALW